MRILVTGGCGFIGSHLVERLANEGHTVTVIDDGRASRDGMLYQVVGVSYYFDSVQSFFDLGYHDEIPFDFIFHLANTPRVQRSFEEPYETFSNNLETTLMVLEMARTKQVPLWFAASSSTLHSDPQSNPYTTSKWMCEKAIEAYEKHYKVSVVQMFFYSVYGPREADYGPYSTLVRACKTAVQNNEPIKLYGTGEKTRDFTHVDDIIEGIMKAFKSDLPDSGSIYLGAGNPEKVIDVIRAFRQPYIQLPERPGEADTTECNLSWQFMPEKPIRVLDYIKEWMRYDR